MRTMLTLCFLSVVVLNTTAQILPDNRATDWTSAGLTAGSRHSITRINLIEQGADPSGNSSCNNVIASAIASLQGKSGVMFFPAGTYFFDASITLPDSVVIQGEGASETVFNFNLGGSGDLLSAQGSWAGSPDTLVANAVVGDSIVEIADASLWQVGDLARLHKDDQDLVNDSWAYYSVAQIVRIKAVNGNLLTLDQTLRTDFPLSRYASLRKINPKRQVGIECLKIKRLDSSTSQSKNIHFRYATECWVRGVESDQCNFGHVVIDASSHVEVTGCHFHHAFDYGGGGKAYGVVLHGSASLCLVENNIFNHLRHSILLQSGANGNVVAFNYSTDPYWTGFPNNIAGDIVCHGNFPFLNLFEHNIVQNIVVDNSHGANGPYNTFFRNRAELYGILMSATNSPDQNFIGNEITGTGLGQGNYALMGTGHFEYGNNDNGTIVPDGTGDLTDVSYFYSSQPEFLAESLPLIGPPGSPNTKSIPARDRFLAATGLTVCGSICSQAYFHWTGWTGCAQNSSWHDPENWSSGMIPSLEDAVFIPAGMGTNYPSLDQNVTIRLLDLEQGASVHIPEGVEFKVLAE